MPCSIYRQEKTLKHDFVSRGINDFWCFGSKQELVGNFQTLHYRRYLKSMQVYNRLPLHTEESSLQKMSRTAWVTFSTVSVHIRGECQKFYSER
ncbi:hypothetical protein [Scytonema hofmannii]|uniref:hypothetical protein n=1 Tax=Scytonema hofmannii TaxID=34078 RepID=UPI001314800D|nr:hypothetical protein [Scytonema hofmannii]